MYSYDSMTLRRTSDGSLAGEVVHSDADGTTGHEMTDDEREAYLDAFGFAGDMVRDGEL